MKINIEVEGDFKNINAWMAKMLLGAPVDTLRKLGDEGSKSLADKTPKRTGETASGWDVRVESRFGRSEVSWSNTAHPHLRVNLARLLDQGYITGTGGYVPPRPYIKDAMTSIWRNVDDVVIKEWVK